MLVTQTFKQTVLYLLLFFGLTCQPSYAQYSGGGWQAQQNTAHPNYYDWNGLLLNASPLQTGSGGVTYNGVQGVSYTSVPPIGGPGHAASWSGSIVGPVVYYWLWSPPAPAANFPQPPLYVLQRADMGLKYALSDPTNTLGLSYQANGDDGVGDPLALHAPPFSSSSSPSGVTITGHKIKLATGSSSVSASVSPTISGAISGTSPGGAMYPVLGITENMYPIVLSSPDPFGRPDLGDGTNQFVYDAALPNGNLVVPGGISIPGTAADDTVWLMRDPRLGTHVALTLDVPPETTSQGWALWDHTIYASVPVSSIIAEYGNLPNLVSGCWYAGLPKANTGFGNHLTTLKVDTNASQQAHFQTFFIGAATDNNSVATANYPGAATDYTNSNANVALRYYVPNWYHYYNLASTSTGSYDAANSKQQFLAYTDAWIPFNIHIETGTYGAGSAILEPVFDINPTADPATGEKLVRSVGTLTITGLQKYIAICAHEKGHQNVFNMTDTVTGLPIYSSCQSNGLLKQSCMQLSQMESEVRAFLR